MAGFMIAAPRSGSGKTMVTCGILELLKRKQKNPFSYKCGPDYIDGLFHRKVLGIEGGNLDSFFEQPQTMREKYAAVSETHFPVVEGVMGYFDGLGGDTAAASSWEVADILDLPVVLVVDAKGASLSLAALIKGFQVFQGESQSSQANKNGNHIQAVILNRISPMLYPRMKAVIEKETGVLVAGYVPELDFWQVGSRHLGLVLPGEIKNLQEQMRQLGDCLEKTLDVDALLKLGEKADIDALGSVTVTADGSSQKCEAQKNADLVLQNQLSGEKISHSAIRIRLGVAWDEAFCFYYRDNLEFLEKQGVQIVRFSPVHDKHLPDDLDGLLLGGGYPELYAKALEENETIRNEIRRKAEEDMPILAECGGYLYLLKELEDENGTGYEMAGVFSGKGYKKGKNSHFGYITVQTERDSLYLKAGETIKGHEFHYWESTQDENELKMQAKKPTGKRGWPCVTVKNQVMAGFPHLYYPSQEGFGERFVQACDRYRMKRKRQQ